MSKPWVRITKFEDLDFPCWLCAIETKQVHHWRTFRDLKEKEAMYELYTHWMPATPDTYPEPPLVEGQDEKDARLITEIIQDYMSDSTAEGMPDLCRVALSHERSEIRQLLKRHQCGELPAPEVIREISRRVKLT